MGGDNVSIWLVIFPSAEFEIRAACLGDARECVEIMRRKYGIKQSATYEMYRLREG